MSGTADRRGPRTTRVRWRRGTEPKHGALVGLDVALAPVVGGLAVLAWLSDLPTLLCVLLTATAVLGVLSAIRELRLLRRASRRAFIDSTRSHG